jgi:hypothetical protein
MFDSAQSILSNYIDTSKVSRFTFFSIEMERGENLEDIYYLCSINDRCYVVFETDYIMDTLADVAQEAADIFKTYDLAAAHWIVKKDSQPSVGESTVPLGADHADKLRESLVLERAGTDFSYALRYVVIEFTDPRRSKQVRFSPTAYGGTITQ